MRLSILLVPFALLTGCFGPNMEGDWEGTVEASGYEFDFNFTVDEDKGGDLSGSAEMNSSGYVFEGDLEGTRDKDEVDFDVDLMLSGYTFPLSVKGTVDGDDFDGTWSSNGYTGDVTATRK